VRSEHHTVFEVFERGDHKGKKVWSAHKTLISPHVQREEGPNTKKKTKKKKRESRANVCFGVLKRKSIVLCRGGRKKDRESKKVGEYVLELSGAMPSKTTEKKTEKGQTGRECLALKSKTPPEVEKDAHPTGKEQALCSGKMKW